MDQRWLAAPSVVLAILLAAVIGPRAAAQPLEDNHYPRLAQVVRPKPPADADPRGTARVEIHVGKDGFVTNVKVLYSTRDAALPIVEAVQKWVFEPLVRDGQAVESTVLVSLNLVWRDFPFSSVEDQIRGLVNAAAEQALAPGERLQVLEERFSSSPAERRSCLFVDLAKVSFDAGEFAKARSYASQALDTATRPEDSSYGNAAYYGNMILGRLALRDGDIAEAKRRLLAAARTPGSPQLNTFGPNVSLAKELLEKGEREVVLQFFELCRSFWKPHPEKLDAWSGTVREGGMPNFGANLVY